MSDLVERLNEYAEGKWHPEDVADLITDAADEIKHLRGALDAHKDDYDRMHNQLLSEKFALECELDKTDAEIKDLYIQNQDWSDKLGDAQAEIERFQHWNEHLATAHAEIKRLTACLKWEQNWLERVGTHAPGCWQWGPGHYLCAIRHIEEMERD